MRIVLAALLCAIVGVSPASAAYRLAAVRRLPIEGLDRTGHVRDPRTAPGVPYVSFEFYDAEHDRVQVYLGRLEGAGGVPGRVSSVRCVTGRAGLDPFQLDGAFRPQGEGARFGPSKRDRPRLVAAVTRRTAYRGTARINLDVLLVEPGRRRFLTAHPENDAHPDFAPDGRSVVFTSGRTGQGDLYAVRLGAASAEPVRLTFDAGGSELYPTWSPDGRRLAYVGHAAGSDHVYVLSDVPRLLAEPSDTIRRSRVRQATRDLTPNWQATCLAPSFSPDGRWIAFFSRSHPGEAADLYVVPAEGGTPVLRYRGALPPTRGGPRWSPRSDGWIVVRDDADRLNPLVWVPLDPARQPRVLRTPTQLNADPWLAEWKGRVLLLFTAQGSSGAVQKRWRSLYAALLVEADVETSR